VTDSAAGATAFSCALKSYNGAIAVTPDRKPCATVLEAAKENGLMTGLVVTSRITHATPASFSSHVLWRDWEADIAVQQMGDYALGRRVDLMFGGGRCFFLPQGMAGSCRNDTRHLWAEAAKYGWNTISTKQEFADLEGDKSKLPLMGLFTLDHMSYEIDRRPSNEPSLAEMVKKALSILTDATQHAEQGFFLMIEGSRIDMAAHSNDPAAHVHEILAYQEMVDTVRDYVDTHGETDVVSVSDHETGGFTLGRQINATYPEYLWRPEVIERVTASTEQGAIGIHTFNGTDAERSTFISQLLQKEFGIADSTQDELAALLNRTATPMDTMYALGDMVSRRASIGWTTHGHTGVDVNLYAYGPHAPRLAGNHENTDIGNFISAVLRLNLGDLTDRLNQPGAIKMNPNKPPPFKFGISDPSSHKHAV
jgi:alkaline phosphatase